MYPWLLDVKIWEKFVLITINNNYSILCTDSTLYLLIYTEKKKTLMKVLIFFLISNIYVKFFKKLAFSVENLWNVLMCIWMTHLYSNVTIIVSEA